MSVFGASIVFALVTTAPPPPASLPALTQTEAVSDAEAALFADWVADIARKVSEGYARPVSVGQVLTAGINELYFAAGKSVPNDIRVRLASADGGDGTKRVLAEARAALGQPDAVRGLRAFVVTVNGFSHATDSYCGLIWMPGGAIAEAESISGLGFQLEGVTGPRWLAYLLEANGAWRGALPPGEPRPPVGSRWVVQRVIPGGPASKSGLRPGDFVTHYNGVEITEANHAKLFRQLAARLEPSPLDPLAADPTPPPARGITLRIRRPGDDRSHDLALTRRRYVPESIFGVIRRRDGSWDHMLDRDAKIGYVRVGTIESGDAGENGADAAFEAALDELTRLGVRGLILDLRWCPGGYVDPTSRLAGALLPRGQVIATVQHRDPTGNSPRTYTAELPPGRRDFLNLPVLVLVNGETTGGGEMIAAALQDHGRAVIAGQRTFGKANLMNLINTPFYPLHFRVSTGYSFRPNGKPRHRFPDSKPSDEWGVKPNKGFEIPVTPDLSEQLRVMAEIQAGRSPAGSLAVAFDDPIADPQKLVAARMLRELLEKKK